MSRIEWKDVFRTNNSEIDAQHEKWIAMYNELHETLLHGSIDDLLAVTDRTLKEIADYASYHFEFEEEFMKSIGFPHIVAHKRLHKDFDTQVYELNRDVQEGRTVLNTQLAKIMRNWIVDHIEMSDRKYAEFCGLVKK